LHFKPDGTSFFIANNARIFQFVTPAPFEVQKLVEFESYISIKNTSVASNLYSGFNGSDPNNYIKSNLEFQTTTNLATKTSAEFAALFDFGTTSTLDNFGVLNIKDFKDFYGYTGSNEQVLSMVYDVNQEKPVLAWSYIDGGGF
jgi:hypothetical protein